MLVEPLNIVVDNVRREMALLEQIEKLVANLKANGAMVKLPRVGVQI